MTSRWPGLVRLAFGLTGDRWLAEDLAQTALASAYASWWRVHRADDPDAYVRRILINASKSRLRRLRVRNANGAPNVLTVLAHGELMGLNLAPPGGLFAHTAPGVWANTDKDRIDIASSREAQPIGTGTVAGMTWHIRTAIGLFGQCYVATLRGGPGGGRGQSADQCLPVAAPPGTVALDPVSIPGGATELTGYAGLVNPRTARVDVALSDGTIPPAKPITIAGRAYIAFAVPPGSRVRQLKLFDSAGHMFGSTTTLPRG